MKFDWKALNNQAEYKTLIASLKLPREVGVKKLKCKSNSKCITNDAILPRKGPLTRAMNKRLQEDQARAVEEGLRVLMNLRVDF